MLAQYHAIEVAGYGANQEAYRQGLAENTQGVPEHIALAPGNNALEHQNREQGAHGVDNDAFPAQDVGQF